MKTNRIRKHLAGFCPASTLFVLCLLTIINLLALPQLRADDSGQPTRAIRLSYVDGKVELAQGDQVIASQAVINTPLLQGMTLTSAEDGKAEIQFEDGSVARLAPNSSLTLTTLAGSGQSADAELTLNRGEAYFELQGNGQVGQMRVQFADSVVSGSGFTVLRIQNDTPPGSLAVFSGNAQIDRSTGVSLDLHGGESVSFIGNDPNANNVTENIASDSWDTWNSDRDQALNAESAKQTNVPANLAPGQASNPAWSDLDANGSWYNVPSQGYVWSPNDASNAGFDPYGNGNWVYTPGFGYTWASGYSWGYLPYSCGAWNYYDGFGWGWAPASAVAIHGGHGLLRGPLHWIHAGWYRPLHRPGTTPVPIRGRPVPMIAVNRHLTAASGAFPSRGQNTPVNIGGATVVALRPSPGAATPRPTGIARGFTVAPRGSFTGSMRGNFNGSAGGSVNSRPVYTAPRSAYNPSSPPGTRVYSGQTGGNTAPGRTYAPPAPSHPSNSNTGGGIPHPSAGSSGSAGGYHGGGSTGGGGGGGGGGHSGGHR